MFFKSIGDENYSDVMIPSLFFDLYIPIANGNQIKVYLLGYKSAFLYRGFHSDEMDNQAMANIIGITEDEVISAWKFWENMGIIKIHNRDDGLAIEFLDIKTEYLSKHTRSKSSKENLDNTLDTASSFEYVNMYNKIEKIAGRVLTPPEKIDILDSLKLYDFETDIAVKAFERAAEDNGRIKSVKYVIGIMKSWFDNSVKSEEDIEFLEESRSDKKENYKTVFRALGFNRTPTEFEKEAIDRWVFEYKMSMDVILKACSKSVNTSNPNIRYFDKIITSWHEKGINSIEAIELEDKKFAQSRSKKQNIKNKSTSYSSPKIKTKFHNFKQRDTGEYSDEELDKLLRNSNKK